MEPISHTTLVMMIKHAVNRHGVNLDQLCSQAGIPVNELLDIMGHARYANASYVAKLAHALMLDWGAIWVRYSYWRYLEETRKAALGKKKRLQGSPVERPAYESELRGIARQIIQDAPDTPAQALALEMSQGFALDMQQLLNMISEIRGYQNTGEYA